MLAAETALSIQVHPSRPQAEAGFRAENERGLAPGDKSRNYADDWPKPEILCALTPFEALAGMRSPQDAAALLKELAVGQLDPVTAILAAASGPEALTEALAAILAWPPERRRGAGGGRRARLRGGRGGRRPVRGGLRRGGAARTGSTRATSA